MISVIVATPKVSVDITCRPDELVADCDPLTVVNTEDTRVVVIGTVVSTVVDCGVTTVVSTVVGATAPLEGPMLSEPRPVFGGEALSDEVTTTW